MLSKSKVQERRTYHQHCGVARALDLVGERWTLLIVRDLLLGPRRYGDLLSALDGITTNLLAKRLRELTRAGLLQKQPAPPPASGELYALTELGRGLEPVVMELGRWGSRFLATPRRGDVRDIGWALLSLRRRYAGGLSAIIEVCAGERRFELTFEPERLLVQERPSERAVVRLAARDQEPLFHLLFGGVAFSVLESKRALAVEGDRKVLGAALAALAAAPPVDAGAQVG